MPILKILYFDSSAILSWFLNEQGGAVVSKIFNDSVRNFCSTNISRTIYNEIDNKLTQKQKNPIRRQSYLSLLSAFIIVDQHLKDNAEMERWRKNLLLAQPKLNKQKHSQDSKIINELETYLEGFAGQSHPVLVSCDELMNEICTAIGYKVFNPKIKTYENFLSFIN